MIGEWKPEKISHVSLKNGPDAEQSSRFWQRWACPRPPGSSNSKLRWSSPPHTVVQEACIKKNLNLLDSTFSGINDVPLVISNQYLLSFYRFIIQIWSLKAKTNSFVPFSPSFLDGCVVTQSHIKVPNMKRQWVRDMNGPLFCIRSSSRIFQPFDLWSTF